jgi:hypothetical protein
MADHVAQRTLVKSPPELWAEVSEQGTLANRLEAFGEVRITRLEPETSVAWEGNDIRGTVELEPAGWGTIVTLRAAPVVEQSAAEPGGATGGHGTPAPVKTGFFARMFRRRRRTAATTEEQQTPGPLPLDVLEPEATPGPTLDTLLTAVLDDLGSAHHRPFSRG